MAKSANQKRKLPILARLLLERSDEEHPVSTQEMLEELQRWDITAERKSIYDDMEQLRELGYDAVSLAGGYTAWLLFHVREEQKSEVSKKAEQSIRKKFRKSIWSKFTKAINQYELIKEGDSIAVCISGGEKIPC